jgi:two-component system sensor histidine kinase NreB
LTCTECFFKQSRMPSFEMRIRTKDGGDYQVAASSTLLLEDSGAPMVLILRDMSEQLRAERERNQQKLTNYVIQAQEEERKRISRELHDGVGQALYSILVGLNVISQCQMDQQVKALLTDVQQMTARAMEEVKSLAVELRPSALDDLGLLPAIRSYMKRYEQTFGIDVTLEVTGSQRRYPPAIETALYRILQEAMTNAAKYADTEKILVRFNDAETGIDLTITDYGVGFDPEHIGIKGTGLGLFGMKERALLLGGTVEIRSSAGQGTSVSVHIPLKRGETLNADSHFDIG